MQLPMKIFPAVHYSMGGRGRLHQMEIPGLLLR